VSRTAKPRNFPPVASCETTFGQLSGLNLNIHQSSITQRFPGIKSLVLGGVLWRTSGEQRPIGQYPRTPKRGERNAGEIRSLA
jgi:hypothetical protein